jgi:cyclic pyranopterin phosphate synthase
MRTTARATARRSRSRLRRFARKQHARRGRDVGLAHQALADKDRVHARGGGVKKGDVLAVAQVAGVMGAKRTPDVIPLCHPLLLTGVDLAFDLRDDLPGLEIRATVRVRGQTGVEMEALTAVSVACLTIYDMVKAAERGMRIEGIRLLEKSGGASGEWRAGR